MRRALQRRHPLTGLRQRRREVLPVGLELAEGEVGRYRGLGRGLPLGFEGPDHETAAVVAHIDVAVEVAQGRQVAARALDSLVCSHMVLGCEQRQAGAGEQRQLARPQAGRDHGHLTLDQAAVGLDRRDPPSADGRAAAARAAQAKAGHPAALDHAHAGRSRRPSAVA